MSIEEIDITEYLFDNLDRHKKKILVLENHIEELESELKEKHIKILHYKRSNDYLFISNISLFITIGLFIFKQ